MSDERNLYESETRRTTAEVVDFLQQLAQWLGDRRLAFDTKGGVVEMTIPDEVMLEIEIDEEDEGREFVKRSLEIEIEWLEARGERPEASEEE